MRTTGPQIYVDVLLANLRGSYHLWERTLHSDWPSYQERSELVMMTNTTSVFIIKLKVLIKWNVVNREFCHLMALRIILLFEYISQLLLMLYNLIFINFSWRSMKNIFMVKYFWEYKIRRNSNRFCYLHKKMSPVSTKQYLHVSDGNVCNPPITLVDILWDIVFSRNPTIAMKGQNILVIP